MSKYFGQLLLHIRSDTHPRSWICMKGENIGPIIKKLENTILKTGVWTRRSLSAKIASALRCSHNTVEQLFRRKKGFYPIPFILELAKLNKRRNALLKKIEHNARYVKVNSASAKPVKVVRSLNRNLSKIMGAFMADGSLSMQVVVASPRQSELTEIENKLNNLRIRYSLGNAPSRKQCYISIQINGENFSSLREIIATCALSVQTHYNIELTDMYRDNVEAFNRWIWQEFRIRPTCFGKKGKNAWKTIFSSKILARYFMQLFAVVPGPKTYTAHEPLVIRKSPLTIRKSFARGVLMFDGCVTNRNKVAFTTVSRELCRSISDIWSKDGISFGASQSRGKEFNLLTTSKNKKQKLIQYFEEETQKWKLFNWLSGDIRYPPTTRSVNSSSLSVEKVLSVLKEIKKGDAFFLRKYFACSHTTIRGFLKILRDQEKIKLSQWPRGIYRDGIEKSASVSLVVPVHNHIFRNLKEKFYEYQNCAAFLEIPKATLSAWKVRKNRIPLEYLERLCGILDFNYDKILQGVRETDREIAEVI